MSKVIWLVLFSVLFCVLHSVTASLWFKRKTEKIFGDLLFQRYYSLIYSLIAVITLGLVLAYSRNVPDKTLWSIETAIPLRLIQVLGVGIFIWASGALNILDFLGVSQALGKQTLNKPKLITCGAYRLCRHPLYFGIILFLWAQPNMSLISLIFVVVSTLYFYLGSIPEEKKLELLFGDEYRQYKKYTPKLFPFPRIK